MTYEGQRYATDSQPEGIAWRACGGTGRCVVGVRMKATSRREDDMEAMVKNVDEQEDYSLYG